MTEPTVTYVTSYINIYERVYGNRDIEWRTRHFRNLMLANINIYAFISPEYEEILLEMTKGYPNVILKTIDFIYS